MAPKAVNEGIAKPSKRKVLRDDDDDDESAEGSDVEMLDVSFDFFDPQPHDYHSLKLLLSQLLSHDAASLDMGAVADLVLEQKLVGSTVKTDGNEGDPYAILTVLNLNVHQDKPSIAALTSYLLDKVKSNAALHSALAELLAVPITGSSAGSPKHVGLVLSERLVNMPAQIMPPAYNMLQEELQWARDDNEPYFFSHLLFLSRSFLASSDSFDEDPNAALNAADYAAPAGTKKAKKRKQNHKGAAGQATVADDKIQELMWPYHPEDDFIAKHATHSHTFNYSSSPRSSKGEAGVGGGGGGTGVNGDDSFGVETRGQVMLVPWPRFEQMVQGLEAYVGAAMVAQA